MIACKFLKTMTNLNTCCLINISTTFNFISWGLAWIKRSRLMPLVERRHSWHCWAPRQGSTGCGHRSGTVLWCAACTTAVRWRKKFCFTNFHVLCCSHETQTTCWDHPKMTELYQSLGKTSLPDVWCFYFIFFFSFQLNDLLRQRFPEKGNQK